MADGVQSDISMVEHNDMLISDKGSIHWNGDLKNLQDFVTSLDLPIVKWSSPGGDCKLYESEGIAIRWYSKKGTITLDGERSDEIRDKIIQKCLNFKPAKVSSKSIEAEEVDELNKSLAEGSVLTLENSTMCLQPSTYAIDPKISQNTLMAKPKASQANLDFTITVLSQTENLHSDSSSMDNDLGASTVQRLADNFNNKFEALSREVADIKENKVFSIIILENTIIDLKGEKQKLCQTNNELREFNQLLRQNITELNSTVHRIEEEKQSLLTALKTQRFQQAKSIIALEFQYWIT